MGIKVQGPILAISDDQAPYGHPDRFEFIEALYTWMRKQYGEPFVIHLGDETDQHCYSTYSQNPNLHGTLREEELAQADLDQWERLFPNLHLVMSNHAIRVRKRICEAGVSDRWVRSFNDAWNKPGWTWHEDLYLDLPNGDTVYVNHGEGKTAIGKAKLLGCSVLQGHRHSEAYVQYCNNGRRTIWGAQAGSLVDPKSLAYLYAKHSDFKSVLGTVIVVEGVAQFCPMLVDKKGRWTGMLV